MKDTFPGFYSPSDKALRDAWKSDKTLFVFDTNTLLNLYGYAEQTREDFFSLLEKISNKIWMPYQVALEYQRRRLSVVRDEKAVFSKIEDLLSKIDGIFTKEFSQLALGRRFPDLSRDTEALNKGINKLIADYRKSVSHWDTKQPCVRGHDSVRERLDKCFSGKIGPLPESQKWLDEVFLEGEERYKNKVPPGYEDDDKKKEIDNVYYYAGLRYERRFGDLVLWKQLIEHASDPDVNAVIFVTDDAKEDWWYLLNSRGEKKIGPRAELREEICRKSNVNLFTIYNTADFMEEGGGLLKVKIRDESVSEAGDAFNVSVVTNRNIVEEYYKKLASIAEMQVPKELQSRFEEFERMNSHYQNEWNAISEKARNVLLAQEYSIPEKVRESLMRHAMWERARSKAASEMLDEFAKGNRDKGRKDDSGDPEDPKC